MTVKLKAAYDDACRRHPEFPDAIDSQGVILAEEALELTMEMLGAVLAVVRSINDHRDEVPNLDRIREETTHVGAVVKRMLGRLDGAKG